MTKNGKTNKFKQKAFLFARKGQKKASVKVQNPPEELKEGACAGVDRTH